MQKFCYLLILSALIISVSLAPTTQMVKKTTIDSLYAETVTLITNKIKIPGKDRIVNVTEEFNREDPKCVQKSIKTFIDGIPYFDGLADNKKAITENLNKIAESFNDPSCPSLEETDCKLFSTDLKDFKSRLTDFLNELPSNCMVLKPLSSAKI